MAGTAQYKRIVQVFTLTSLGNTNAQVVFDRPCKVLSVSMTTTLGSTRSLRLFNKVTVPVPGADVPAMIFYTPATSQKDVIFPDGVPFSNGLSLAITGTLTPNSSTAVAAGDVFITITYSEV